MSDPNLLAYVTDLERERDSYRDAYRFWKSYRNNNVTVDGEKRADVFERVLMERGRLLGILDAAVSESPHASGCRSAVLPGCDCWLADAHDALK